MSIYLGVDLKLLDEHLKKPKKTLKQKIVFCKWPVNKIKNRPHPSLNRTEKTYQKHNHLNFQLYIQRYNHICHYYTQHRGILNIAYHGHKTGSKEQLLLKKQRNVNIEKTKTFFLL